MDKYFEYITKLPEGVFVSAMLLTASVLTFIIIGVLAVAEIVFGFNPHVILFGLVVVLPAYVLLKYLWLKKGE